MPALDRAGVTKYRRRAPRRLSLQALAGRPVAGDDRKVEDKAGRRKREQPRKAELVRAHPTPDFECAAERYEERGKSQQPDLVLVQESVKRRNKIR